MRLSDIKAQEAAVRALRGSIKKALVTHAYLFAGPRNTGKTTAALSFAATLNCTDPTPEGDACGFCMSCVRIQAGSDADVVLIPPEKDQTTIDQMREMIRSLDYAPLSGKYKVVIVEQADTLNPHSENCILKILEEAPPYAVLILVVANPNALLPTIRSRCRTVRFRRAGTLEVEEFLKERFDLPSEERRVIATCAQGAIGRAVTLASGTEFMEERQVVLQMMRDWADGPPVLSLQAAELIRRLAEPKKDDPDERTRIVRLTEALRHILSWYADLLALKVRGDRAAMVNADCEDDLKALEGHYSIGRLREAVKVIMETRRRIEGNITPQLALENMFFDLRPDPG